MNTPVLETERLLLRKFNENDLEALFRIYSDVEVNRFLPWFPLKTMEEARAFWQKQYAEIYKQERAYQYAICLKKDNIPIGYIGVSMEEPHDFGYGLCKEYWHRGIMTEAGRAVIERVKADGMPYITATHDRENPRSGGVMIRLGMKYQYSYEEQWQPKDISVIFRLYQLNFDEEQNRVYRGYWNHSDVHFVEKDCTVQNREG
ncbi:MAG TPA: GNAT family N-acetyltransferase [Lachnospiraceae bacterium]|nr:GNAT family N-acetyltransferase [Lachnospiraceae bacterium]